MTPPDHPLPAGGGSYIRNPDGSLNLIDPETGLPVAENQSADQPELIGVDLAAPGAEVETVPAEVPAEPEAPAAEPVKPTVKRGGKAPAKEG